MQWQRCAAQTTGDVGLEGLAHLKSVQLTVE